VKKNSPTSALRPFISSITKISLWVCSSPRADAVVVAVAAEVLEAAEAPEDADAEELEDADALGDAEAAASASVAGVAGAVDVVDGDGDGVDVELALGGGQVAVHHGAPAAGARPACVLIVCRQSTI
jgi:hypothetical protein